MIINGTLRIARNFYIKYKRKNHMGLCAKYINFDTSSNIEHLTIDVRKAADKKFMEIGRDSLIAGNYIFEKESGFISIGERTQIGMSNFHCIDGIEIGDDVLISWGCTFIDNNSHSINSADRIKDTFDWKRGVEEGTPGIYKNWDVVNQDKITVKNKAWIGFNCIILKGVIIGEGAVIGAGSVVVRDVLPYTLVMGNPAKAVWKTK